MNPAPCIPLTHSLKSLFPPLITRNLGRFSGGYNFPSALKKIASVQGEPAITCRARGTLEEEILGLVRPTRVN